MKNFSFRVAAAGALALASMCAPVSAQPQGQQGGNFGNGGATFQLPPSVQNVVSIDAQNMIIIVSEGESEGEIVYTPSIIQHVYSGGIARLFGGTTVPTAQFATPGQANTGQNNNGGFGQNNGVNNFGGGGFGNGGFGNNGGNNFGGGGFGQNNGGNNFGGGGFNNGGFGAFQSGVLSGNGFNTQNRDTVTNLRVRPR